MAEPLGPTFFDEMSPQGPRRLLAIGLIFLVGLLPLLPPWTASRAFGASPSAAASVAPASSPSLAFASPRSGFRLTDPSATMFFAAIGGAVGMLLYQPRRGFKLCALVAGPLIGLGAVWAVQAYLSIRPDVMRFEPLVAAVLGGLPGVLVYAVLTRIAYAHQTARPALATAV